MPNEYDIYLYSSYKNKFENKTNEIREYFFDGSNLKVIFKSKGAISPSRGHSLYLCAWCCMCHRSKKR